MVEPMLSDIKESRFYQEIEEEIGDEKRYEEKRKIAAAMLRKNMKIDLISELTGLSIESILEISKQLSEQRNGEQGVNG